jgi:hypothetical protein
VIRAKEKAEEAFFQLKAGYGVNFFISCFIKFGLLLGYFPSLVLSVDFWENHSRYLPFQKIYFYSSFFPPLPSFKMYFPSFRLF